MKNAIRKLFKRISFQKFKISLLLSGIIAAVLSFSVDLQKFEEMFLAYGGTALICTCFALYPQGDKIFVRLGFGFVKFFISLIIISFWLDLLSGKEFAWYAIILLLCGLIFICYNLVSFLFSLCKTFSLVISKLTAKFVSENKSPLIVGGENLIAFALSVCTLATALASVINAVGRH